MMCCPRNTVSGGGETSTKEDIVVVVSVEIGAAIVGYVE